jgi:hypothetical protein
MHRKADSLFVQAQAQKGQQIWQQTSEAYRQITNAYPEDGLAWFRLGFSLHFARQLDEAIEANKVAATYDRGRPLALYNIACSYALKQDKESALDYLEQAIEAGFRSQPPIENDTDMACLLDNSRFQELAMAARPTSQRPERRQLDFWVGEWVVYSGLTDKQVGTDKVTRAENGFLLVEEWKGTDQSTGRSFNWYDPESGKWIHQWVDGSGSAAKYEGTWSEELGTMTFQGERVSADGESIRMRMTFTPRPDRSIHQLIEQSEDGETWEKAFDAVYLPKGSNGMQSAELGCLFPPECDSLANPDEPGRFNRGCT